MRVCNWSVIALVLLAPAAAATGQVVDHYDMSRVGSRNDLGQPVYPAGVSDPGLVNPPSPATEVAVPPPPPPDSPLRTIPSVPPVGPASPAILSNTDGPGSPSCLPAAPAYPSVVVRDAASPFPPASWYTRIDYFHWNERIGGQDFVNESGTLFTVGYQRQIGSERFRGEIFGGDVHYDGYGQLDDGSLETLTSNTGYLGLRGEYEMVLAPAAWKGNAAFLLGVGSRFWIRDLHDGTDNAGDPVWGYQEAWWTTYPFLGLETHYWLTSRLDLYSETRAGMTAVTYEYATAGYSDRPLWPRPGVLFNAELGLRGERLYLAARAEVLSWEQSSEIQGTLQPHSVMYTVGARLGYMF